MTKETFPFKVGEKICLPSWTPDNYAQILYMGNEKILFVDNHGKENSGYYGEAWKGWKPAKKVKRNATK